MSKVLDISSRGVGLERALSNFARRPFFIDGVMCASMEGFLQSLKFEDQTQQKIMCSLAGYEAFRRGQEGNAWKADQILYWRDDFYCRHSEDYVDLLARAYDALFDQNPDFRDCLRQTTGMRLRHSMGKSDARDSVLTESEYITQLERLRWRALEKS